MNQENWNALTAKLAESENVQAQIDQLQATLAQLRTDIGQLSTALQDELAQLRPTPTDEAANA